MVSVVLLSIVLLQSHYIRFVQVKLIFEEPESGVTVVKLVQTDVPEEDRLVVVRVTILLILLLVRTMSSDFRQINGLQSDADMGMELLWRTQKEAGEISSFKGYEQSLALDFKC